MTDLTSISSMLTSITSALEIAKLIKDSDVTLEKSEQKLKLANLIDTIVEIKIQYADVKQVLLDKDQEISKLKQQLDLENELEFDAPYYWRIKNGKKDGPFCPQCQDSSKKLIRLQKHENGYWDCKTCTNGFYDKSHVPYVHQVDTNSDPHGWMEN